MTRLLTGPLLAVLLTLAIAVTGQSASLATRHDAQVITAVWYAADAGEAPHRLRPVEVIRGRPVLQVHYANGGWLHPLDLTVELETLNTNWRRRVSWRITKNWSELEDYVHVMIEPHPICSAGIECRLTIRYGDDVWESRLIWQED